MTALNHTAKNHTAKREKLLAQLADGVTVFDGAMGTEIYRNHVFTNACFDELNRSRADLIHKIHRSYINAGAEVLTTNTFGANRINLEKYGFADQTAEINRLGAKIAGEAAAESNREKILIAGSVGPLTDPVSSNNTAQPLAVLTEQIAALIDGGVDFIFFETLPDRASFLLAAEAMQSFGDFPFILSASVTGNETDAELAEWFAPIPENRPQPAAIGLNCGLGPAEMLTAAQRIMPYLALPLVIQPNAGKPKEFERRQIYYCSPEYIATYAMEYAKLGARGIGGCCGTSAEHIAEIAKMVRPWSKRPTFAVSSVQTSEKKADPKPETPFASRSRLAEKLAGGEWITTVELTPPRGYDLTDTLEKVRKLSAFGVDAVNLPDGPRASSRLSSIAVAKRILELNEPIEPILHFCCRDRNLIGMQADLLGCAAMNIRNILFITGDPPKLGNYPDATGVFDTDSVGLCRMQKNLNCGIDLGGDSLPAPTEAVFGAGVDPTAPDLVKEREKFFRKIEAGAAFAITQPVFDAEALLRFLDDCGEIPIPVIAGVWPLTSYKNAVFMQNEVPGVNVPDAVFDQMAAASEQSKEAQMAVGVKIARQIIDQIRSAVQGVQISAPFGRIELSMAVLAANGSDSAR